MQFKHWFVFFLCFAGPFGWYFLFWRPQQHLTRLRIRTLRMIKENLIPSLLSVKNTDPLQCLNTLKAWVAKFSFTEAEIGYSMNDLAHFASLCLEVQITEVRVERDRVHAELVAAKEDNAGFLSVYQWALFVENTHLRYRELCNRHDDLWLQRGRIRTECDFRRSEKESGQVLLFLFGREKSTT